VRLSERTHKPKALRYCYTSRASHLCSYAEIWNSILALFVGFTEGDAPFSTPVNATNQLNYLKIPELTQRKTLVGVTHKLPYTT